MESRSDTATTTAPSRSPYTSVLEQLHEATRAVQLATRRRESELELLERTLSASTSSTSPAARQAVERMTRVRAEHLEDLSHLQSALRALVEAERLAGEASRETEQHQEQRSSVDEELAALRAELAAQSEEAAVQARELVELRRELEEKTRESAELADLMGVLAGEPSTLPEPPADEREQSGGPPAPTLSAAEVPTVELPNGVVQDLVDEFAGFDLSSPRTSGAEPSGEEPASALDDAGEPSSQEQLTRDWGTLLDSGEGGAVMTWTGPEDPPPVTMPSESSAAPAASAEAAGSAAAPETKHDEGAGQPASTGPTGGSVAPPQAPITGPAKHDVDAQLQAYLRAFGQSSKERQEAPFRVKAPLEEFRCATPDETKVVSALQRQPRSPADLAAEVGLDVGLVRQMLEVYRVRGLVERGA